MLKNAGAQLQLFTLFTGKSALTSYSSLVHNWVSHEFKCCHYPAPSQLHPWGCGGTFIHWAGSSAHTSYSLEAVYMYILTWFSTPQMQPRPLWYTFLLFPLCLWWVSFCHSFLGKEQPLRLQAKEWTCKAEEQNRVKTADLFQNTTQAATT